MSNLGKKFVISLICHDLNGFEKINLSIIVSEQIGDKCIYFKHLILRGWDKKSRNLI